MHHCALYFKRGLIAIIAGLVDNCNFSTSSKYCLYMDTYTMQSFESENHIYFFILVPDSNQIVSSLNDEKNK